MQEYISHQKPKALYDDFVRKAVKDVKTTHYCPGCGHGRIHKLIAEALDDFNLADRTVVVSPVGCSVFAYYYMDTGNIQAAHGRAPAVGTGVQRAQPESVVISYQGDGDLAAIGTAEIIHAANRGENMVVIFVNNAIYGMTGGQMAPTTLVGQKTLTSPRGRNPENEGFPIKMCEIISSLEKPIYVERCAVTEPKYVMNARKAVRKAIKNAGDRKGFSFVEILAACPTGWKVSPKDAMKWIHDKMFPQFPVKVFRDVSDETSENPYKEETLSPDEIFKALNLEKGKTQDAQVSADFNEQRVKIAGFGGQGVLTAGVMLSAAGMNEGLNVSWIPSYGPEMRGGTANCSVNISTNRIGSPLVTQPNILIAMNGPSLDSFENDVEKDGIIIVNSSIVDRKVKRSDVKSYHIPVTQIAADLGFRNAGNMVALGAYIAATGVFSKDRIHEIIRIGLKKKEYVEVNIKAVDAGFDYIKKNQ